MIGQPPPDIDWGDPLDRSHPLAADLRFYWPGLPSLGSRNLAGSFVASAVVGRDLVEGGSVVGNASTVGVPKVVVTPIGERYAFRTVHANACKATGVARSWASGNNATLIAFFTANSVGAYYGIFQGRHSGNAPSLMCSGASGNPLTMMWSIVSAEYDASTGLTIPTDGSVCMAAMTVSNGTRTVWLFTQANPAGASYTIAGTATAGVCGVGGKLNWTIGNELGSSSRAYDGAVWNCVASQRPWSESELRGFYNDEWQLLRRLPSPKRLVAAAIDLVVNDATFTSTFDNVTLSQNHSLGVSDQSLSLVFDSPSLTQAHNVLVDDSFNVLLFDIVSLTQDHTVIVDDSTYGLVLDNVSLTVSTVLVVDDIELSVLFDSPIITQDHGLTVADCLFQTLFDTPTVTQDHVLSVNDSELSIVFESPTISQVHYLIVSDLEESLVFDSITVTQAHTLVLVDCRFSLLFDNVSITQETPILYLIEVNDMSLTLVFDTITLSVLHRVRVSTSHGLATIGTVSMLESPTMALTQGQTTIGTLSNQNSPLIVSSNQEQPATEGSHD